MEPEQLSDADRVEAFLTAFNEIEQKLKREVGKDYSESISSAALAYKTRYPRWNSDYESMRAFIDLRNVLVHMRFRMHEHLSIPSPEAVRQIRALRDRLLNPIVAYSFIRDRFPKNLQVEEVVPTMTLAELLVAIQRSGFTQFPVIDGTGLKGLATSIGLTNWLAIGSGTLSLVDLADHTVADLLLCEESRANCELAARTALLDELFHRFSENVELEAVLITNSGKPTEKPLAILTLRCSSLA